MPAGVSPEHLSRVLRLCNVLAYRALDAKIMGLSVPAEQAVALERVIRLLQDHRVEWPPLLAQVLRELEGKATEPEPEPRVEPLEDDDLQGLTLFLAGFRAKDRS